MISAHRFAASCLLLTLLAAGAVALAPSAWSPPAVPVITAEIVGAGAVKVEHVGKQEAPSTSAGTVSVVPMLWFPDFLPGGTRIQARIGTRFGIEVRVKREAAEGESEKAMVALRTRVTHPPTTNPESSEARTVEEWDSPMNVGIPRFAGWAFEQPWELVPGRWRIEILDGDRVIAGQDFEVTVASDEGQQESPPPPALTERL